MTCPRCGKEINNNLLVCNFCNTRLNQPNSSIYYNNQLMNSKKKNGSGVKTALIVLIIIALTFILGCCGLSAMVVLFGGTDGEKTERTATFQEDFTLEPMNTTTTVTSTVDTEMTVVEETTVETTEAIETTVDEQQVADEVPENGIRPEIKEAIDSYEAFVDEYVEFMSTYSDSSSTDVMDMLTEYYDYLQKANDMSAKFDAIEDMDLTDEELSYYLEVQLRCSEKMLKVAYSMFG